MYKEKIIKLFTMSIVIISILFNSYCIVYGAGDPVSNTSAYKINASTQDEKELKSKVGVILGAVNTVGVIASVVTLGIIGIKYMFGSLEDLLNYQTYTLFL